MLVEMEEPVSKVKHAFHTCFLVHNIYKFISLSMFRKKKNPNNTTNLVTLKYRGKTSKVVVVSPNSSWRRISSGSKQSQ